MKQLKQLYFRLTYLYNQLFITTSADSCTFPNKDSCNAFCLESDHIHVYLIILLTQEEEHSQLFPQQSVEFLVRTIHFAHFIHPYMNLLPYT